AVAGGRRDHARRARPDVADREDAGPAGLDEKRTAAKRSPWLCLFDARPEVGAGQDETVGVEGERAVEPSRWRLGADQHAHRAGRGRAPLAGGAVLDDDPCQAAVAFHGPHLMREEDLDARLATDPLAQVPGHALLEPRAADDQEDAVSLLGERERRLAGGVRSAYDDDTRARRQLLARDVNGVGHPRALV